MKKKKDQRKRDSKGRYIKSLNEFIIMKDHAEIVLYDTRGIESRRVRISKSDVVRAKKYKWHSSSGYIYRLVEGGKQGLHRFLLDPPAGYFVDHKDHDPLNNTRENIRLCTQQENGWNFDRFEGLSKFKGVTFSPKENKYRARIGYNNKRLHLGKFKDELSAAKAYDRAARKYFGHFALTNEEKFPELFK